MPILWKNGYLVTLRYCEVSVTEFVFRYLFIYFAQVFALFLGYAHALKFLNLFFYYCFICCFYFLLLVGFTHSSLSLNSFMWDLCTELGCHMIEKEELFLIQLCKSTKCFIYVTDVFWANIQLYLVLLLLFSFKRHVINMGSNGLAWSFRVQSFNSKFYNKQVFFRLLIRDLPVWQFDSGLFVDYCHYCIWKLIQFRMLSWQQERIFSEAKQQLRYYKYNKCNSSRLF